MVSLSVFILCDACALNTEEAVWCLRVRDEALYVGTSLAVQVSMVKGAPFCHASGTLLLTGHSQQWSLLNDSIWLQFCKVATTCQPMHTLVANPAPVLCASHAPTTKEDRSCQMTPCRRYIWQSMACIPWNMHDVCICFMALVKQRTVNSARMRLSNCCGEVP
jgi:hypothetical protein